MNYTFWNLDVGLNRPPSPQYGNTYKKGLENWVNKYIGRVPDQFIIDASGSLSKNVQNIINKKRKNILKVRKTTKFKKQTKKKTNLRLTSLLDSLKIK